MRLLQARVVGGFRFGQGYVADRLQQTAMIEPIDPFERGVLYGFERPPRPAPVDDLGFVEAVDRLGASVVVTSPTLPTDGTRPASARRSV